MTRSTRFRRAALFATVAMLTTAIGAFAVAATSGPDTAFRVRPASASASDRRVVVHGTTAFALDVYGQLRATPGNFVFSPISLSTALAMTAEGAAGPTRAEIVAALHVALPGARRPRAFQSVLARLTPADASGVEIDVANGVWSSLPLRPAFKNRLLVRFGARAESVDFRDPAHALQTINDWGSEATHGLVPDAFSADDLPAKDGFVLADAVYFKGGWEHPFATRTDDWFLAPVGSVAVPLMREIESLPAAYFDDVKMVELPYVGDDYAMLVLVPTSQSSLADLEG
jgi:serpin B